MLTQESTNGSDLTASSASSLWLCSSGCASALSALYLPFRPPRLCLRKQSTGVRSKRLKIDLFNRLHTDTRGYMIQQPLASSKTVVSKIYYLHILSIIRVHIFEYKSCQFILITWYSLPFTISAFTISLFYRLIISKLTIFHF